MNTVIRKDINDKKWRAETWLKSDKDGYWFKVVTQKMSGGLQTYCQEVRAHSANAFVYEFEMFSKNFRSIHYRHPDLKSTEKSVTSRHGESLELVLDHFKIRELNQA